MDVRIEYAPNEIVAAKFGGPLVKIEVDSRGTMASFRRQGEATFVQTDYRDEEVVSIVTSKLLDPVTRQIVVENARDGSKSQYTAHRQ